MAKAPKHAKVAGNPVEQKRARYQDPCIEGHPLAWRFSGCDKGGPFGWVIPADAKFREVIEKLHEFEGKTWPEIMATGSHAIEVHQICKAARDRLVDIQRDDLDQLMSFRLTGPNRVWCDKNGHIMRVLWWDLIVDVPAPPPDSTTSG